MHKAISPEGVGEGLKTKINVNLGISKDCTDYSIEWEKVKMAVDMKAEAIMDLSCYGKTHEFRQKLIDECPAMIGTVPMYDAAILAATIPSLTSSALGSLKCSAGVT